MLPRAWFLLPLVWAGLSVQADPVSATIERTPPPSYPAPSSAYNFYKSVTVTQTAPDTFAVKVLLQGPIPDRAPDGVGSRWDFEIETLETKPTGNSSSMPFHLTFLQNPGSSKLYTIPSHVQQRNEEWPVKLSDLQRQPEGFSFTVQSPLYTQENLRLWFHFSGKLLSVESPTGQRPLVVNLAKPGTLTQDDASMMEPVPERSNPAPTPPGSLANALTHPQAPAPQRVDFGEIPDYLEFKSLTLTRSTNSITLNASLEAPLPAQLARNDGLRFAFHISLEEIDRRRHPAPAAFPSTTRKKPQPEPPKSLVVNLDMAPRKSHFEWTTDGTSSAEAIHTAQLKATTFTPTKDGFSVTFTSPLFTPSVPIRVSITGSELWIREEKGVNSSVPLQRRSGPLRGYVYSPATATGLNQALP